MAVIKFFTPVHPQAPKAPMQRPKPLEQPFEAVRASCLKRVESCSTASSVFGVDVDEERLAEFVAGLDADEVRKSDGHGFPLQFKSVDAHVDFVCLLHLLNFGSGYRELLHKHGGRGAFDTVSFGLMGMYMSKGSLDADFMVQQSLMQVSQFFGVPITESVEVKPALYQDQPHPLKPLAEMIHKTMQRAGATLMARQCASFAEFILDKPMSSRIEVVEEDGEEKPPLRAADLVNNLFTAFPDAFHDVAEDGTVLLSKCQLLVAELYRRIGPKDPRFRFPDVDQLTCLGGPVIPAVLVQAGVLQLGAKLQARIEGGKSLKLHGSECTLRAACVVACDRIVERLREAGAEGVNAITLDSYLWWRGKKEPYKNAPRHACKRTPFY